MVMHLVPSDTAGKDLELDLAGATDGIGADRDDIDEDPGHRDREDHTHLVSGALLLARLTGDLSEHGANRALLFLERSFAARGTKGTVEGEARVIDATASDETIALVRDAILNGLPEEVND